MEKSRSFNFKKFYKLLNKSVLFLVVSTRQPLKNDDRLWKAELG